jgi:hypothetical protein
MACGISCWELMADSRACVWIVCDLTGVRSHEAKKIMKEKMKLGHKVRTFLFSCLSQNKPLRGVTDLKRELQYYLHFGHLGSILSFEY